MIVTLQAALFVRAARTLPAGQRDVVALVRRPGGVVHVAVAPLTRSDRWVARAGRTVCHTRTGRLAVLPKRLGRTPDLAGRRLCARCALVLARATDVPGLDGATLTRDQEREVFDLLKPAHLADSLDIVTSVDETHQLSRLTMVLFGPRPLTRRTPLEAQLQDLHDAIRARRRRLEVEAMTPDERDAAARAREQADADQQRLVAARRRADARDRALDRHRRGQYLAPHERQLLPSSA